MNCRAEFVVPEGSAYSMSQVQDSINHCLLQNTLTQLLWLAKYLAGESKDLNSMGIYIDFRVIDQAECLLSALAERFPGMNASISGRYAAHPDNLRNPWCDDMGGYFEVKLENGAVRAEDTPIV